MRALTGLFLVSMVLSILVVASPALANSKTSIGVKEGDWIEYNITVAGRGSAPPTHDVRWMRIEVLQVDATAFSVNLTARYANRTMGSAIWEFNFTEGNVGGWIIIPANLSAGDKFYDSSIHNDKPVNVTVQSEEQKIVLGASRTITSGNDSFRHKEWDKATGVFVGSSECYRNVTLKDGWYIEDLTVTIEASATNMWNPNPPVLGLNPTTFILISASLVLVVLILSLIVVLARKKTITFTHLSQGKIAALVAVVMLVVMVGSVFVVPFFDISLGVHEVNLIMQTFWTSLVLVSMWFRRKGNFFAHAIVMLVVVSAMLVSFSTVLFMDPPNSNSMGVYFTSLPHFTVFLAHAFLSIPAIAFGVWLVALWRPRSTSFATKSRRIVQLVAMFWVLSYVAGVLGFLWLHTNIFGYSSLQ